MFIWIFLYSQDLSSSSSIGWHVCTFTAGDTSPGGCSCAGNNSCRKAVFQQVTLLISLSSKAVKMQRKNMSARAGPHKLKLFQEMWSNIHINIHLSFPLQGKHTHVSLLLLLLLLLSLSLSHTHIDTHTHSLTEAHYFSGHFVNPLRVSSGQPDQTISCPIDENNPLRCEAGSVEIPPDVCKLKS